jgi:hypothetical protein
MENHEFASRLIFVIPLFASYMQEGEIEKRSSPGHPNPSSVILYSSMMLPRSDTYRPSKNYDPISMCRSDEKLRIIVTYLTDILVTDTADLLDVGSTLGDGLEGVSGQLELILDVGGRDDVDTGLSNHAADVLLTEEVTVRKDCQLPCSSLPSSLPGLE